MSTQTSPPPSFLDTLVSQRKQVGIGLAVAGVILAALAIWWGVWGFSRSGDPTPAPKTPGAVLPEEPEKKAETPSESKPRKSPDYQIAAVWAGSLALLALLSAVWLFTQPPDPAAPATSARVEVLTFGGSAGLITALCGVFLGYRWHQSLVMWVGGGDAREARWVLYAAAIFLAGLLIMFASLQLARSEQRANATLRRVLYGFNSVFVGLLLLLLLIAINVFAFMKVPTTLVANESAFTGLSDGSKTFLRLLDRPVKAYLILPESHIVDVGGVVAYRTLYSDCRGLLSQCEDQSREFKAAYLSPAFDKERIAALMERLKIREADRDQLGLLVAVGEDESVHAFIPASELIEVQRTREGGQIVFQGENRLMTELMFLTDARSKQKVYFTQGHGELGIDIGGDPARSATNIVRYLRDRKVTVEPLTFDGPDAKVPEDAAVVVIAGPQQTIPEGDPMLAALRDYMKRSGKIIALLPTFRSAQGKVAATGLETLFRDFGVDVDAQHRIVSAPGQFETMDNRIMPQSCAVIGVLPRIDVSLGRAIGRMPLVFQDTRQVRPLEGAPNPNRRVTPLLGTAFITWLEDGYTENLMTIWTSIRNDREGKLIQEKQVHLREAFIVTVAVTDRLQAGDKSVDKPRAVIFGSDSLIIDGPPVPVGLEPYRQQLFSDSLDWLRERDASIGVTPRKLPVYMLEKPIEWSSQLVLLVMVALGIAALGGGVWLSRRR